MSRETGEGGSRALSFFRRTVGQKGEDAACRFLKRHGYRVIERNYSCGFGEIDVIVRNDDTLVFVEVKTLSNDAAADPEIHVNRAKQRQIEKAARAWLHTYGEPELTYRFDVVSIVLPPGGEPRIKHIIDAFRPTGGCR